MVDCDSYFILKDSWGMKGDRERSFGVFNFRRHCSSFFRSNFLDGSFNQLKFFHMDWLVFFIKLDCVSFWFEDYFLSQIFRMFQALFCGTHVKYAGIARLVNSPRKVRNLVGQTHDTAAWDFLVLEDRIVHF